MRRKRCVIARRSEPTHPDTSARAVAAPALVDVARSSTALQNVSHPCAWGFPCIQFNSSSHRYQTGLCGVQFLDVRTAPKSVARDQSQRSLLSGRGSSVISAPGTQMCSSPMGAVSSQWRSPCPWKISSSKSSDTKLFAGPRPLVYGMRAGVLVGFANRRVQPDWRAVSYGEFRGRRKLLRVGDSA
jgi:hypothetical protein